ncbi:MAG: FHA domain-containing protein, partial [Myxococcaceae bacterium]
MAFQLKISKGSGEGKVFSFAEKEARIGRTPENDIIVKDGGVSRNHARVYAKGGKYFVEDLKSSNGTRLNGTTIAGPRELKTGDSVTVGDVTFDFVAVEETRIARDTADEDVSGEMTSPGKAPPRRAPPRAEEEEPEEEEAPPALQAVDDDEAESDADFGPTTAPAPPNSTRKIEVRARRSPPSALAKAGDEAPKAAGIKPSKAARGASAVAPVAPESAAERARRRREASESVVGRALFAFSELSGPGKIATLALLGVVALGGIGGALYSLRGEGPIVRGLEPGRLGTGKITDSFGYGERVSWSRPDMKLFNFELTSATRAVAVLRYQAAAISQDEVVVMVNGVEQGAVPPDNLDTEAREIELVLRPANLKQRDQNTLMFDNTKNPPGDD